MKYIIHSHRDAEAILDSKYKGEWQEIKDMLNEISDDNLIRKFTELQNRPNRVKNKSLSVTINTLIKERLIEKGWLPEANIFNTPEFEESDAWRLDFAKNDISVEVAFNHGEATAWNLLKPVMASEFNHIKKARQTKVGVVIFSTEEMKAKGGFDNAVGTYEKVLKSFLIALNNWLTVPLLIIGLQAPESFYIKVVKVNDKKIGSIATYDS